MSVAVIKREPVNVLNLTKRLDPDLAEAVKGQTDFKLGGNVVESDGKGGDVVLFGAAETFETWRLPALIDEDVKERAALAFQNLKADLSPPSVVELKQWILTLGTLCAMRADVVANTEMITAAYAKMVLALNLPSVCFTDETLSEATAHFQWFPSFHELAAYLESIAAPMRKTLERLKAIRDAAEQDFRGTFDYHTREERAAFWEQRKERDRDAANARWGVMPDDLADLSPDEALKAAYAKAGMEYPGAEKASWVKVAAAGMATDDEGASDGRTYQ